MKRIVPQKHAAPVAVRIQTVAQGMALAVYKYLGQRQRIVLTGDRLRRFRRSLKELNAAVLLPGPLRDCQTDRDLRAGQIDLLAVRAVVVERALIGEEEILRRIGRKLAPAEIVDGRLPHRPANRDRAGQTVGIGQLHSHAGRVEFIVRRIDRSLRAGHDLCVRDGVRKRHQIG